MGYSPWGHTESNTTEGLTLSLSLLRDQVSHWGWRLRAPRAAPPGARGRTGSGMLASAALRPPSWAPTPAGVHSLSASPWMETPPRLSQFMTSAGTDTTRGGGPRDHGCWPFPQLSGKEVRTGPRRPQLSCSAEGHQLTHPQPGGHPQSPLPLGSLGKGLGHGSPGGRGSPALSAWPLQDMTSPCAGQLGPRPTHCAGNVLPAAQTHRKGTQTGPRGAGPTALASAGAIPGGLLG